MDPPTREVGPTPGTGLGHMLDPLIHLGHPVPSPVVVPVALLPRTTGLLLLVTATPTCSTERANDGGQAARESSAQKWLQDEKSGLDGHHEQWRNDQGAPSGTDS